MRFPHGEVRYVPRVLSARPVAPGMAAGRRDALPPRVSLQGAEGAERTVALQGGHVSQQEAGLREGMVQEPPVRGKQQRGLQLLGNSLISSAELCFCALTHRWYTADRIILFSLHPQRKLITIHMQFRNVKYC